MKSTPKPLRERYSKRDREGKADARTVKDASSTPGTFKSLIRQQQQNTVHEASTFVRYGLWHKAVLRASHRVCCDACFTSRPGKHARTRTRSKPVDEHNASTSAIQLSIPGGEALPLGTVVVEQNILSTNKKGYLTP